MGNSACELADRLQFLRLKGKLTRLFEFLLGFFALGEVAGDLCKANNVSAVVANGIDDDIGPKAGSILADAPAFSFEFSFFLGRLQRPCGTPASRSSSV